MIYHYKNGVYYQIIKSKKIIWEYLPYPDDCKYYVEYCQKNIDVIKKMDKKYRRNLENGKSI